MRFCEFEPSWWKIPFGLSKFCGKKTRDLGRFLSYFFQKYYQIFFKFFKEFSTKTARPAKNHQLIAPIMDKKGKNVQAGARYYNADRGFFSQRWVLECLKGLVSVLKFQLLIRFGEDRLVYPTFKLIEA